MTAAAHPLVPQLEREAIDALLAHYDVLDNDARHNKYCRCLQCEGWYRRRREARARLDAAVEALRRYR